MSLNATVKARVDENVKFEVDKIFKEIGLNTSQAINIFLKKVIAERGIPFDLKIPNQETLEAMKDVKNGTNLEKITFQDLQDDMKKCITN